MKYRRLILAATAVAAIAAAGYCSTWIGRGRTEALIRRQNLANIESTARRWKITPRPVAAVSPESIRNRTDADVNGKLVTHQLPPNAPAPFQYAHAHAYLPFISRVRYGWATGGTKMTFGDGGECLVFTFFGLQSRVLVRERHWYF